MINILWTSEKAMYMYVIADWDCMAVSQPIGLEVCDGCDPGNPLPVEAAKVETKESLDLKRRKELNRIKKKYGLRVSMHALASSTLFWEYVLLCEWHPLASQAFYSKSHIGCYMYMRGVMCTHSVPVGQRCVWRAA